MECKLDMTFRYEYYYFNVANINRAQNCTVLYPIGMDILNSNFAHPFWGAYLLKHSLRNEWKWGLNPLQLSILEGDVAILIPFKGMS